MEPVFLTNFTFLDVIWWMLIVFFWMTFLSMFIGVFADIFRRRDHSGVAKATWTVVIFALPVVGILIYMIMRPAVTPTDVGMAGGSSAAEIAQAQQLLQSGAINQAEFEQIKSRALA